ALDIPDSPMSPPPMSPQKEITLIFSWAILPLRISARSPAAIPTADDPPAPSWVCIQGTSHGVVIYEVLATYMQPVDPVTTVRGPATLMKPRITVADSHPWQVRWPEVYSSSRGTLCTLRIFSTGIGFEMAIVALSLRQEKASVPLHSGRGMNGP